ncbi:MAG: tetratricopeptide repeat protein [Planctomycetes bacterium]|nr:tetratricopeptide repeat protein [Planctomycetota bacterium]
MNSIAAILEGKRWLIGLAVVLLLVGVGVYSWLRPVTAIPEMSLDGQDPAVAEAIQDARDAVVKSPRSADAWGHLGRVLLANEAFPDVGFACFLEAERLDPSNPRWPYFSAGYLSVDYGKPAEAAPKLERAVELAEKGGVPNNCPRLLLAETLMTLGQLEQAERHFQHVRAEDPRNVRTLFGLGRVAYARGQWKDCRAHLEACLGSPQARKRASIQLASVCEHLGDKPSAEQHAQNAEKLPRDFDWTDPFVTEHMHLAKRKRDRYRVVENLEAQGDLASAVRILDPLATDDQDDDLPHVMMGRILGQMGRWRDAEVHLLRARKLAPQKVQVHYLLSLVLIGKGETLLANRGDPRFVNTVFEDAAQSARKALAIRPDYGFAHMALGRSLKHLGQKAEALKSLRDAVHCSPEYADNHLYLGQALAEGDNIAEARIHLKQALLLSPPTDPRAKEALEKLDGKSNPKNK